MHPFIEVLIVLLCGVADRVRGAGKPKIPAGIEMGIYGGLISLLLIYPVNLWTIAVIALFWAGSTMGWGHPINQALFGDLRHHPDSKPESWQLGPLKDSVWLALSVRGFLWGAPLLIIAYWVPAVITVPIAFAIAMPLACLIARYQPIYRKDIWAVQEVLRGLIAATIIAIAV